MLHGRESHIRDILEAVEAALAAIGVSQHEQWTEVH